MKTWELKGGGMLFRFEGKWMGEFRDWDEHQGVLDYATGVRAEVGEDPAVLLELDARHPKKGDPDGDGPRSFNARVFLRPEEARALAQHLLAQADKADAVARVLDPDSVARAAETHASHLDDDFDDPPFDEDDGGSSNGSN